MGRRGLRVVAFLGGIVLKSQSLLPELIYLMSPTHHWCLTTVPDKRPAPDDTLTVVEATGRACQNSPTGPDNQF
jgi:hypothetical protein